MLFFEMIAFEKNLRPENDSGKKKNSGHKFDKPDEQLGDFSSFQWSHWLLNTAGVTKLPFLFSSIKPHQMIGGINLKKSIIDL